ncbi:CHAT domain-containing tetratricopeptide repeat protein [Halioxenophilus aromaticivorans]|uniref:CHAT domain-containing protein n=1 Tax=Halioxenophilus aromaticivorans TaxID=1306992 RepID=A0AAV3U4U9_9ALTE
MATPIIKPEITSPTPKPWRLLTIAGQSIASVCLALLFSTNTAAQIAQKQPLASSKQRHTTSATEKQLTLVFDEQQSAVITIEQSPHQTTLLVLPTYGSDLGVHFKEPSTLTKQPDYNPHLLSSTLLISGEECQQCEIVVSRPDGKINGVPSEISAQLIFFSDEFDPRLHVEKTLQKLSSLDYNVKGNTQLENAFLGSIEQLEQSHSPINQARACSFRIVYSMYNQSNVDNINTLKQCINVAEANQQWASYFSLNIEHIRLALWYQDKEEAALAALKNLYRQIPEKLTNSSQSVTDYLLGRTLLTQGMIEAKLGRYSKAERSLKDASKLFAAIGNHYNLAEAESEIGTMYRFQNQYTKAAAHFENAYNTSKQNLLLDSQQRMRIHYQMAAVSLLNGQYYLALKLLETIDQENYTKTKVWKAHILALKARVLLELNRLNEAEKIYARTWTIYQELGSTSHLATLATNLSRLHSSLGNIELAKHYTEESVRLAGNSWGMDQTIRIQQAQVNYHIEQREYDLALTQIETIEQQFTVAKDPYRLGRVLTQKGETLIRLGKYEAAVNVLEQAQSLHNTAGDYLFETKSNYLIAKAFIQAGQPFARVEPYITKAKGLIESIRSNFLDDRIRQEYFALQKDLYELSLSAHVKASLPASALNSLYEAETFKARTLLESMAQTKPAKGRSDNQEITFDFLNSSFKAASKRPSQDTTLAKPSKVALKQHQQSLKADEALVYYFLGQEQSYLWLMDQQGIEVYPLPNESEIAQQTIALVELINSNPAVSNSRSHWANILQADKTLSETLLEPIAQRISRYQQITVVPDGVLHRLPYAVLLSPAQNYQQPLTKTLAVGYANSIATLHHLKQRRRPIGANKGLLMIANPAMEIAESGTNESDNLVLQQLPAAEMEANKLINLWGSVSKSTLLLGRRASKESLYASSPEDYQVIHFASHAKINWDNPTDSAIKLASTNSNDSSDSADLTLAEITELKLNAELVVLSACETASGQLRGGEGPIGLSRAFFEAGANRVLASLWPVEDHATAALLELFYSAILQDEISPGEALQIAQQKMMNNREYAHPYYWSGFIFIGDDRTWTNSDATLISQAVQRSSLQISGLTARGISQAE